MYTAPTSSTATLNSDDVTTLLAELRTLNYQQSVARLMQLTEQHKSDARLALLLAGEHAQAGKMDLAEAAFMSALQCDPDYAIARFQLGLLQFTSARPVVASMTWAPLEQLTPQHPLRLFKTGFEFLARDMTTEAAHAIERGMRENTSNAPLNLDMQKILTAIEKLQLAGNTGRTGKAMISSLAHSNATGMDSASPQATAQDEVTEEPAEHFLVSAYRNLH